MTSSIRRVIQACSWHFLSLVCLLLVSTSAAIASERPNVLFVIADDLNDWVGPLRGHPQVQTPTLDTLAQTAYNFRNAHCNAPLCSPSRASFLSGLHPVTTEYYGYGQNDGHTWRTPPLLRDAVTLTEHFHQAGYIIWGAGKITHNSHHIEPLFNFPDDEISGYGPGAEFGPWPWNGREKMPHPSNLPPFGSRYMAGIAPLSDVPSFPPDTANDIPGHTGWRSNWAGDTPFHYNSEDDRSLMPDELCADFAIEKLKEQHDRPFFMIIGFNRPHIPHYVPQKYFDQYPIDQVQFPPGFNVNDLDDVAPAYQQPSGAWRALLKNYGQEAGLKVATQGYLASVSFVDDQFGRIMEALQASAHANNTIVIFTSDHGYHVFEKLQLGKNTPWDRSTRVPLLIHLPEQTESYVVDYPVELIDLFPTLNALAGLSNEPNVNTNQQPLDGESLVSFFQQPDEPRIAFDYVVTSSKGVNLPDNYTDWPLAKDQISFSLRSRDYRLVRNYLGEEEFYDLRTDPYEWQNLINSAMLQDQISVHRKLLLEETGQPL